VSQRIDRQKEPIKTLAERKGGGKEGCCVEKGRVSKGGESGKHGFFHGGKKGGAITGREDLILSTKKRGGVCCNAITAQKMGRKIVTIPCFPGGKEKGKRRGELTAVQLRRAIAT